MQESERRQQQRIAKLGIGIGAFVCAAVGVLVFLYPEATGLDEATADLVAGILLLVAVADIVLLRYFWARLMGQR